MRFTLLMTIIVAFGLPALVQAQQEESILVDEYIISQEFIAGEVVRVKLRDRKLVVRGEKRGMTREFSIPEGTRITIKGRDARLSDLRRGDSVMVVMKPKAEEVVITRVRVPETPVDIDTRRANPVVAQVVPAMLPKTASPWPALLVAGLLALLGAVTLRTLRRDS